jgi:hypothetical protein
VPGIRGGGRDGACAELVRALARGEAPLRFTELVYFCDPDGAEVPGDAGAQPSPPASREPGVREVLERHRAARASDRGPHSDGYVACAGYGADVGAPGHAAR